MKRASGIFKKKEKPKQADDDFQISAPESHASPERSTAAALPADLEARFLVAADKLGIPAGGRGSMPSQAKWKIVQEYEVRAQRPRPPMLPLIGLLSYPFFFSLGDGPTWRKRRRLPETLEADSRDQKDVRRSLA